MQSAALSLEHNSQASPPCYQVMVPCTTGPCRASQVPHPRTSARGAGCASVQQVLLGLAFIDLWQDEAIAG